MTRWVIAVTGALSGALASCSTAPEQARTRLIGLKDTDLKMCAGLPAKMEVVSPRTRIYTYDLDAGSPGISVSLPVGSINMSNKKNCTAIFRMEDGRVAELNYTGATTLVIRNDNGICEPLIASCLSRMAERR
ncbi:hypothetical protein [Enterovirga rhinocerotis]|uniref:Lipoprotein n=1 Tax=Enterovirga rhinocerotis TaxID=1339210 RepID=A0A4R7BIJ0_9HYPH|nr:hypothetical protein [Enterovirga rhinocerotis]TDR85134.1 hypothetical protein EV668_4676 [Enterovirga rhinocerotis]